MSISQLFKLLFTAFIFFFVMPQSVAQICENPQYITSRLERPNDFSTSTNHIEFDAVINDATCAFGGTSVFWDCSSSTLQNESWVLVKIEDTNTNGFALNISSEENLGIDASIWGPFSTTQFNANDALMQRPSHCTVSGGEGNILLLSGYSGAYYILGMHNETNEPGKIIITNTNANSTVTLSHFVPQENDCVLPTAELISDNILFREEENAFFVPRIRFTGEPPFYFKIQHGNYDYQSPSNIYDWQTYSASLTPYIWKLGSVRNECGTGRLIDSQINRMIYEKGRYLLSCIPFNSNFDDLQNGLNFTTTNASFSNDRDGNSNMAVAFNGINEYLEFPGRDLIGENYIMSLWIRPENLTNSTQSILNLGSTLNDTQKLELINGQFQFTAVLRENQTYITSIKAEMDEWQHVVLIKDNNKIKIVSDIHGKDSTNLISFEVPAYGVHSKLFFGAEKGTANYFKGSLDNFKYFTGTYSDSELTRITSSNNCKLELCDSLARFELPGYKSFVRGVYRAQERLYMFSFPQDTVLYQIGDNPFQKKAINLTGYGDGTYNFYIKDYDKYETVTHFSSKCGTAVLVDTLAYYAAPELVLCYPLNGNTNEFFKLPHESSITAYGNDQDDKPFSAAKFDVNTILKTTFSGRVLHSNYSVSLRFKASEEMLTTTEYELFSYIQGGKEDRCYIRKYDNGTYKIFFQKQQVDKTFSVQLPDLTDLWQHLVLVFQSGDQYTTGYVRLYLNNKELLNLHTTFNNTIANENIFSIGTSKPRSAKKSFIGLIDDFKLFTGALSNEEITTIYNDKSECQVKLCDEIPDLINTASEEVIFDFNEKVGIKYLLKGRGPWLVEYSLNNSGSNFEEFITNPELLPASSYFASLHSLIGENELIINSIKNVCGYSVLDDTTEIYIKPVLYQCLGYDNNVSSPTLETYNLESSNVNLVPDRNNAPNNALAFNTNSHYQFSYPGNLETTITDFNISFWLKPENSRDTMTLFHIGDSIDYYQANLVKESNYYRLLIKRNGYGFNYNSLKEIQSETRIPTNAWSFVSINFLDTRVIIRINGSIDKDVTRSSGRSYPSFRNKDIIYSFGSEIESSYPYSGILDEIKLIHGKINNHEAIALFNSSNCSFNFCPEKRVIPPNIDSPALYQSLNSIRSRSKVSAKLDFFSGKSIELNDGFETSEGAIFNADIKGCPY